MIEYKRNCRCGHIVSCTRKQAHRDYGHWFTVLCPNCDDELTMNWRDKVPYRPENEIQNDETK